MHPNSLSCICYILLIIIPHTDHPFDELPVCPAWYFKDCNLSVSRSISQLINMLLSTFPDSWQCIQRLTFNIEYYFKLIKILCYILKYFFDWFPEMSLLLHTKNQLSICEFLNSAFLNKFDLYRLDTQYYKKLK